MLFGQLECIPPKWNVTWRQDLISRPKLRPDSLSVSNQLQHTYTHKRTQMTQSILGLHRSTSTTGFSSSNGFWALMELLGYNNNLNSVTPRGSDKLVCEEKHKIKTDWCCASSTLCIPGFGILLGIREAHWLVSLSPGPIITSFLVFRWDDWDCWVAWNLLDNKLVHGDNVSLN